MKKPIFKKWWFWVIIVVILGTIGSNSGNNDETTTDTPAATSQPENSTQPEIVEEEEPEPIPEPLVVDVDTLLDVLDDNALNASNTYKGQYVELTGTLSTIDSGGKYFSLNPLDGRLTFKGVRCDITKEQQEIVATFSSKQEVTVIGTISDVGEIMGYTLKVESIK